MISYLDRTFCPGTNCKAKDDCPRALTKEIRDGAKAAGLPLAIFSEYTKLPCYKEIKCPSPSSCFVSPSEPSARVTTTRSSP